MKDEKTSSKRPKQSSEGESPRSVEPSGVLCTGRCSEQRTSSELTRDISGWHPGIVVVEFKTPFPPEVFFPPGRFDARGNENLMSPVQAIQSILIEHKAIKAEWTFSFNSAEERAELDRERFITFHFPAQKAAAELWQIADEFSAVNAVVYAAPEPRLAPPQGLLNEPLAIDGGIPQGIVVENRGIQNQWYLFRCRADLPLSRGISGRGVVVADVDWGFMIGHQDLESRITHSWSIPNQGIYVSRGRRVSHGTGVLGLLGAADNDMGMLGFAPGAKLWAIQADDGSGTLNNENWAKAIDHARKESSGQDRKVILIEASTEKDGNVEGSLLIRKAILNALSSNDNIVVCVPAGNGGVDADLTDDRTHRIPKTDSILVGATAYTEDPTVIKRGLSNFGPRVVVSAPGPREADVTCCACGISSYKNEFGGTSGAAAKVAGAIALMLQENKSLTHCDVREILGSCGPKIPINPAKPKPIGRFLDVEAAVQAAKNFKQQSTPWTSKKFCIS